MCLLPGRGVKAHSSFGKLAAPVRHVGGGGGGGECLRRSWTDQLTCVARQLVRAESGTLHLPSAAVVYYLLSPAGCPYPFPPGQGYQDTVNGQEGDRTSSEDINFSGNNEFGTAVLISHLFLCGVLTSAHGDSLTLHPGGRPATVRASS